ncbi:MAG TPA: T9SS type A sorting domain-containing protein [Bacteroidales bacterium]|nr:T9SS type A sorting domain-containing protein [Bacteroidales bacterium]HPS15584.1 T9SS type A sorting domain-containing protein [Bacteroidales bacterium]
MKKIYFILILLPFLFSFQVFSQSFKDEAIINKEKINIFSYPNPANKILTFSFTGIELSKTEIEIFELTGQPVMKVKPDNEQYTIDVLNLKEGIYFYKIIYNGEIITTEKFVVLRK